MDHAFVFFFVSSEVEDVVEPVDEIVEIFPETGIQIFVVVRHDLDVLDQQTLV